MNKGELVKELAEKTGQSQAGTEKLLNALIETIVETTKKNEKITLVGFGTFEIRTRKATTGFNPRTREKINIPAKRALKFNTSDVINRALN
jgi:DNA-binding protein HU-beta